MGWIASEELSDTPQEFYIRLLERATDRETSWNALGYVKQGYMFIMRAEDGLFVAIKIPYRYRIAHREQGIIATIEN